MFVQKKIDGVVELGIRFNAINLLDTRNIKSMDLISRPGTEVQNNPASCLDKRGNNGRIFIGNKATGCFWSVDSNKIAVR